MTQLGTRTELKNLNSFRFVEKAIEIEAERQIDVLEDGGEVVQETRLYDSDRDETRPMRSKEEANDYRYFPDPDLLPVVVDASVIESIRDGLPELPDEKRARFAEQYGLSEYDADVLTGSADLADYFERAAAAAPSTESKTVANWVQGKVIAALNEGGLEIAQSKVTAEVLGELLEKITDGTLSGKLANEVFDAVRSGEGSVAEIIDERGLEQITDTSAIDALVGRGSSRSPGSSRPVPRRQPQGIGILRRPSHESLAGQGEPSTSQRGAAPLARGMMH